MICLTYHDLVFSRASRAHLGTKTVARDRSRLDLHLAAAGHSYLCGDKDHLKVFANEDAAEIWLQENDPEGVAFEYEVLE